MKNTNPLKKKDIIDSSILIEDNEEDSKILKEGSISKDLKIHNSRPRPDRQLQNCEIAELQNCKREPQATSERGLNNSCANHSKQASN